MDSPAKPKFRSWVEDYVKPEPPFNAEAVRYVMAMRGKKHVAGVSKNTKAYVSIKANRDARDAQDEHRRTDPFEKAKSFLQRRGPVFSATYRNGPAHQWFVAGQSGFLTSDELIALAKRKGWSE